ncbi:MAG: hypothetical protein Q9164_001115 [Protoblastenia rupestris]
MPLQEKIGTLESEMAQKDKIIADLNAQLAYAEGKVTQLAAMAESFHGISTSLLAQIRNWGNDNKGFVAAITEENNNKTKYFFDLFFFLTTRICTYNPDGTTTDSFLT